MNCSATTAPTAATTAYRGLRLDQVSVAYQTSKGPLQALKGLDLEVGEGEFVAVLGPSGCGKSTILKLVSGLLPVSSGRIEIFGRPVTGPRADVGIVFQQPNLLPWKTVRDNVLVPVRAQRLRVDDYREAADELLASVGLSAFGDHLPNELSGGMQQRVGIARALVHDPKVLLMDEPFAALDALSRERISIEMQQVWMRAQKTVLFITHSIPEAVFLADRVVALSPRPGRKVLELVIPFERPRTLSTMEQPQFGVLCNQLRRSFDLADAAGKRDST